MADENIRSELIVLCRILNSLVISSYVHYSFLTLSQGDPFERLISSDERGAQLSRIELAWSGARRTSSRSSFVGGSWSLEGVGWRHPPRFCAGHYCILWLGYREPRGASWPQPIHALVRLTDSVNCDFGEISRWAPHYRIRLPYFRSIARLKRWIKHSPCPILDESYMNRVLRWKKHSEIPHWGYSVQGFLVLNEFEDTLQKLSIILAI